jgi:iron complex outermembrane receptor protein
MNNTVRGVPLVALMAPCLAAQPGQAAEVEGEPPAAGTPADESGEGTVTLETLEVTSTTATKTELPVFETPFTLNEVPQEIIQDQNVIELKDALKNVSGVVTGFENGGGNDNFSIRGFDLGNVVYRDGVRLVLPRIDPANVEGVEVLKRAAASLFGRIEPGGLVNAVTKKPLDQPYFSIDQQIGELDFYRTEADATGPLTGDGSWLYRAVFSSGQDH